MPPARPGPWTEDGLIAIELEAGALGGGEGGELALVLGALVDRHVAAAVRAVLGADRALDLADRGGRGREHDARDVGAGRGADGGLGAADVDVQEQRGVLGAERVDAGDVVEQRAVRHPIGERVLVERVAADDVVDAFGLELGGRGVVAGERHDVVAAGQERLGERAADQPAAAGEEDARHRVIRRAGPGGRGRGSRPPTRP